MGRRVRCAMVLHRQYATRTNRWLWERVVQRLIRYDNRELKIRLTQ